MKPETKQALTGALYEALFVVLGVVLALGANEWQKSQADRRHARAALGSILEELRANHSNVKSSLEYHQGVLAAITEAGNEPPTLSAFERGFVNPAQLYRNAWEAAVETDAANNMPYASLLLLSKLYADQDRYDSQQSMVGQIIYARLYEGGTRAVLENPRGLASLVSTFVYRETQLLASYDQVFSALDEGGSPS
ncbi:MAG: hypothetical protein MI919_09420 [Holophagales bacterium]|nr:hypothetical protein [Holophagales bacterium]